ncbi:MAG: aquaporin [Candidatus Nanosyncoccaceae bacterium]
MAKSKAKKGKKNTTSKKATEKAVEAKLAEKEELAVEAEEVEKVDEEVVEEETKDEEVEEVEDEVEADDEDSEDEDEESEDEEDEDDDEDEEDDEDESEDDEDDESDDEDEDDEEVEVEPKKVEKKAKKADKKAEKKAEKVKTDEKKETAKVITVAAKANPVKEFFARKFDASENILTIFKSGKIFGALIGELLGTAAITAIVLTLGLNPIYVVFAYLGITLAVFKLSGANLNPVITAGMLATRRMSAIRGVLYLIAQVLGSWIAYLVVNAFLQAGIATGNVQGTTALPALATADSITVATEGASYFWAITMIEFIGAIIFAFIFARALAYKRSSFTFAATVAAGMFTAILFALTVSMNYLGISQEYTYVLNPATAVVYGLFPSSAEGFDALMQALMPMLVSYVIFPVLGGIVGFYASDIAGKLSGENLSEE